VVIGDGAAAASAADIGDGAAADSAGGELAKLTSTQGDGPTAESGRPVYILRSAQV
jgi:hypothetical protein